MNKYDEIGDQKGKAEYIREQLKIYPNDPALLTNLAHALQCWYFHSGKANTEALRKEKSDEIRLRWSSFLSSMSRSPSSLLNEEERKSCPLSGSLAGLRILFPG